MTLLTEPTRIVLRKTPSTWAEGGDLTYTIVVSGTSYRVHEFKTVGTTSLNVMVGGNIEYLVIGGGGGGGGTASSTAAGAGGAGGLLSGTANASVQNYSIVVGNGGMGGGANVRGSQGGNTSAFGLTAIGGGGGGAGAANVNGGSGGSGGGGGGPGGTGGAGTPGQGNSGGVQWAYGGGAGFSGASATTPGQGLQSSITGTALWYAGGGAGPFGQPQPLGGGGGGDTSVNGDQSQDGAPNTGGGAGARWGLRNGRSGGSGIVIVRYAI